TGAGVGAAGGALLGQAIGRNTEATLIGAAVGTMLGYIVGNEMDKYDRQQLNRAYETIPAGQTSSWQNPDSGNYYQMTPQPAYYPNPQTPCRRAEILATIDGRTEKTYTTACRNSAGQWELQN
ncbi:MAG: glycine zipper domain-containing protein, partial [Desulforhopalus sp.]